MEALSRCVTCPETQSQEVAKLGLNADTRAIETVPLDITVCLSPISTCAQCHLQHTVQWPQALIPHTYMDKMGEKNLIVKASNE